MLLKKVFHGIINGINYHIKYKLNYGMKPTYLIYQITQRCNGKCIMCNIWDKEFKKEVEINDISKAFSDRLFDNLKWIVLTGGEPFLRNDLVEIIKILNKLPHLKWITINTNGFLTKKIISNVKDILKILRADITLSLTVSGSSFAPNTPVLRWTNTSTPALSISVCASTNPANRRRQRGKNRSAWTP